MMKCPAEIVLEISKHCETRRDLAALVATCRHVHGHLEAYLYRREFDAARLAERDHEAAIFQASHDLARMSTLRKWIRYIPKDRKTNSSRRGWYLGAALRTAASAGNKPAVILLLSHGAPKNSQNFEDQTAFMCSLIAGHVSIAKLLSSAGCVMSLGTEFNSPLHVACRLGDKAIEIVRIMFDCGIDPYNVSTNYFSSAPGEAAGAGSLDLLQQFATRGVDLSSGVHYTIQTLPVYAALVNCQYEALEYLLRAGFFPPWDSHNGRILLARTCSRATVGSMRLFFKYTGLTANSLVGQLDPLLIHVLRSRVNQDRERLVRFLISQGVEVNCCDIHGTSALAHAISQFRSDSAELLDILINAGADVRRSFCLIERAILDRSFHCLARLIQAGVDLSERGPGGMTPLILASALLDGRELVEIILRHETDNINAVDDNGETALQCAVRSGCSGSVQKLLDHGADANQFTEEGTSILSLAVRHNELGSLFFLLNAGADVNALDQDPTGLSPLMHAIMRGNSLAHWTLLDHGANREVRDRTGRGVKELSLECNFTG